MGKFLLLSFFMFCLIPLLHSQSKSRDGEYYYKIKTYDRAIKGFERELKKDPENDKLMFKLVDSYLNSNLDRSKALPFAKKLAHKNASSLNILNYGKMLFYADKFEEALVQFEGVKKKTGPEDEEYISAQQYTDWLINAQAYKNKPVNVSFINLGRKINTAKNEMNPMADAKDRLLMYSNNKRYHSYVGVYYYNVCVSVNKKREWLKPKTIGSALNSGYDEIVSGLTSDGKKLFVHHNRDWMEQIGFSDYKGNYKFSKLEPFDEGWDKKKGTFGVWQSSSQDTILFVGESENGDTDIFYALKLPSGELGEARLVPGHINTKMEENFPVLTPDGKRLYFSSNSNASMGGYDLFYSDWDQVNMEWKTPVNLGYPLNDKYDNYTICHTYGLRYAYVAAIRPEGYGEKDIYKVVYNEQRASNLILKCRTYLQTDTGKIVPPFRLRAELRDSVSSTMVGRYTSSLDSAKFVMALEPGKYMMNLYKRDVLLQTVPVNVPEIWYDNIPQQLEFVLPEKAQSDVKEAK